METLFPRFLRTWAEVFFRDLCYDFLKREGKETLKTLPHSDSEPRTFPLLAFPLDILHPRVPKTNRAFGLRLLNSEITPTSVPFHEEKLNTESWHFLQF